MLQKTVNNYCPTMFLVSNICSNICLSVDKYESVLYLRNPKLLYSLPEDSNDNLQMEVSGFVNLPYNLKNEKKNKLNSKSLDLIENKKNRLKQKKKIRDKFNLDKDFSSTTEDLGLDEIKTLPFVRSSKSFKNKKNKVIEAKDILLDTLDNRGPLSPTYSKQVYLDNLLTVEELAIKLNVPSAEIIKWLFLQGISITINQLLDLSISTLVAKHYSFIVLQKKIEDNSLKGEKEKKVKGQARSPIITLLGHVDHGKTTLLNAIRKSNQLEKESGNITQSIGLYEVSVDNNPKIKKLIFLDTPGHEAFISVRRRGIEITDLVILVVSADDGLKPQTVEAINHIQTRCLPFVVVINKIDKVEANIDRVKNQLSTFNINAEDSGGTVPIIGINAITGENVDLLLSTLLNLPEIQDLQSDPSQQANGIILESYLDKQRGPIARILVRNGTLFVGSLMVAGNIYGKVKAIVDGYNCKVLQISSVALAEVLAFSSVPDVGLPFEVVCDEKAAKSLSSRYIALKTTYNSLNTRVALESVDRTGTRHVIKQVNVIIKTDVQGSIDPIIYAFSKIPQEKVQINVLLISSGDVSLKDIQLASTSHSIILVFNLDVSSAILSNAESAGIVVKQFHIIYDLVDYIKNYMLTFVEIKYTKEVLGHAEVKSVFFINKGVVAGCVVLNGSLRKNEYITVTRKNQIIYSGLLNSLKVVKEDVDEVFAGNECGIMCKDYSQWQTQDKIEAYIRKPLEKTL